MQDRLSRRAVASSVAAALFLVASLLAISEIAASPTAEAGVLTSTWTPLRGVFSLVGGADTFGGSWDLGPMVGGLAIIIAVATALGLAGIALIVFLLGREPPPLAAILVGTAWGMAVQIALVGLLVGGLLGDLPAYDSVPAWGWWLSTLPWGAALGLIFAAAGSAAERHATDGAV